MCKQKNPPHKCSGKDLKVESVGALSPGIKFALPDVKRVRLQVTSYGGFLRYTGQFSPGLDATPNSYPDIEISVSSAM